MQTRANAEQMQLKNYAVNQNTKLKKIAFYCNRGNSDYADPVAKV